MRRFAWGVLVLSPLSLAACPEDVDTATSSTGSGGAAMTYEASACGSCVLASCGSEKDACASDPGCAAHLDCMLDCPLSGLDIDPSCLGACPKPETAVGIAAEDALRGCREDARASCVAECGEGGGGGHPILDQDCPPSMATLECDKCMPEHCCETPCDADCQELQACAGNCPDYACIDQCFADHPAGLASIGKWQVCQMIFCGHCPPANNNACLDCGVQYCPELLADCFSDADGYLHFQCSGRCDAGDTACEDACDAEHPKGAELWGAFIFCTADHCAGGPCPTGPT